MAGGMNDQTPSNAGPEADLDTQFGFGLSYPTPGTFYSVGGSPPFTPDVLSPTDTNEPYDDVRGAIPLSFANVLTVAFWGCSISGCNLCCR
jgi:hypothetical protein